MAENASTTQNKTCISARATPKCLVGENDGVILTVCILILGDCHTVHHCQNTIKRELSSEDEQADPGPRLSTMENTDSSPSRNTTETPLLRPVRTTAGRNHDYGVSEQIGWRDLPHQGQLAIITFARMSEPLVQTSLRVRLVLRPKARI